MLDGPPLVLLYQTILLGACILTISVAIVARQNRPNRGATYLTLTTVGVTLWIAPNVLQTVTDSQELVLVLSRLAYVGITLTMPAWFLLAAAYTRRDRLRSRPVRIALWAMSASMLVVVWSGHFVDHGLLYADVAGSSASFMDLRIDHGAAFYVWVGYGYVLTMASLYMFADWFRRSEDLYRRQAVMVMVAAICPLTANLLYVSELLAVDATPLGFAVGSAALAFGVFEFRLTDVAPVARQSLMRNIRDGVLVLDADGRITDANPASRTLLGLDGSAIGRPAEAVLDGPVAAIAASAGEAETRELVTLTDGTEARRVDVRVWPQYDDGGRSLGHLFYLRDVTERERHERELERQNERLDRFAGLLSHDLRNPLAVAEGYVEATRETGDVSHLADVSVAHERIEELVDDVLTMAREGEAVEDPEPVRLDEVARAAWDTVETDGATLQLRTEAVVLSDPSRLRRVFENLFRNSVEHGDDDDLVVTVGDVHERPPGGSGGDPRRRDDPFGFYVADDGVGIPDDDRVDVLEDGFTTTEDGTGLGLSVVDSIADAHGWDVRVTTSRDEGARFEFLGTTSPSMAAPVPASDGC